MRRASALWSVLLVAAAAADEGVEVPRTASGTPVTVRYAGASIVRRMRGSDRSRTLTVLLDVTAERTAAVDFSLAALTFGGADVPQAIDRASLGQPQVRYRSPDGQTLQPVPPAGPTAIAAGQTARVGLVFAGLPEGSTVPPLSISAPGLDRPLDVRAMAAAAAEFSQTAVGPGGAVGVISFGGMLDRLGVQSLVDRAAAAMRAGSRRAVVVVEAGATYSEAGVRDWLLRQASKPPGGATYLTDLPTMPGGLQSVWVADEAGDLRANLGRRRRDETEPRVRDRADAAVFEAAFPATAGLARDAVLAGLRAATHPGITAALLGRGRDVFRRGDLKLVTGALASDSPAVREEAVRALGAFPQAEASARLVGYFAGEDESLRRAAQEALSSGRHAGAVAGLDRIPAAALTDAAALSELARRPRPTWAEDLKRAGESGDAGLRAAGLAGLMRLGGEAGQRAATRAVLDEDEDVRAAAAAVLSEGASEPLRRAVRAAARRRLLGRRIEADVIAMLGPAFDAAVVDRMLDRLPGLTPSTARAALRAITAGASDAQEARLADLVIDAAERAEAKPADAAIVPGGLAALRNRRSPRLTAVAAAVLAADPDASPQAARAALGGVGGWDAAEVLREPFEAADEPRRMVDLANAMAEVGGTAVEAYFRRMVSLHADDPPADADRQAAALSALRIVRENDPSHAYWTRHGAGTADDAAAGAVARTTLAMRPGQPDALFRLGMSALQGDDPDMHAAAGWFAQFDPEDPLTADCRVGLALSLVGGGDAAAGVRAIESLPGWMLEDSLPAYNAACTLGLAVTDIAAGGPEHPLAGRSDELREWGVDLVETSLNGGMNQFELMREDPDLTSLRGDRLNALIDAAEKR